VAERRHPPGKIDSPAVTYYVTHDARLRVDVDR
jgi:hypothetical protein